MKKLSISILEFVLSLPAHKLPAVFDLEQCPFPQGEIRLEEVLEEIIRLKSGGLIEANVLKGFDGKPTKVQIRYVTLKGRIYLEGVNPLASQRSAQKKILGAGLAAVLTIGLLLLVGVRHRKSDAVPAAAPLPSPTGTPAPTPEPTPEATPTPMATPATTPEPTPSPSPKHREKPHAPPVVQ